MGLTHHFVRTAEARPFGRFLASSLSSSIVDLAAFAALCALLEPAAGSTAAILAATVAARVLSSLCNYLINYFFVFHSRIRHGRSATLYTAVTVIKTAASARGVGARGAPRPPPRAARGRKNPGGGRGVFVNYLAQKRFVY